MIALCDWAAKPLWSNPPEIVEQDLEKLDQQSWSALHHAAWSGGLKKVTWLVEQGTSMFSQHQSPLFLACRKAQINPEWIKVAQFLWEHDPNPEQARWGHVTYGGSLTLLEWAIEHNIEWLLDACGKRQWELQQRTFLIAYLNDSVRPFLKLDRYWKRVEVLPDHHPWWKDIWEQRSVMHREILDQEILQVEKEKGIQRL